MSWGRERGKAWHNRQLHCIPQDCILPGTTIIMNCLERKEGREGERESGSEGGRERERGEGEREGAVQTTALSHPKRLYITRDNHNNITMNCLERKGGWE